MGDDALSEGMVLSGAYRIVKLIGRGGMGEVYEALHQRTGAPFAVKVLAGASAKDDGILERFRREGEVTSRLRHPNIVKVFDFDRLPDGRPFLAMELLSGMDLAALSAAQGLPMPVARVVSIVDQVSLALFAAHQAGVVHRDLKPANLFIESLPGSDRDLVRVLDFGISKLRNAAAGLTRTMAVLGTPHYMSPEQATGKSKEIDERSDQFSLATIVYELLTGRQAFGADEGGGDDAVLAIVYRVVHQEPPSWAALGIELPAAIEGVVRRGLAKSPSDRFPTIRAFGEAFTQAVAESRLDAVAESRSKGSVERPVVPAARAVPATMVLPERAPERNTTLSMAAGEATTAASAVRQSAAPAPTRKSTAIAKPSRAGRFVVVGAVVVLGLGIGIYKLRGQGAGTMARIEVPTTPAAAPPAQSAPVPPAIEPAKRPATVVVEIEQAPERVSVREGDRILPLPLTLPNDGQVHHLMFKAPEREDLALDVVGRDGERVSLGTMAPLRRTSAPHPAHRPKAPPVPSKTRNEDI